MRIATPSGSSGMVRMRAVAPIRDRRERLDAVLHAIHQDLRQLAAVPTDGRQVSGQLELEHDMVRLELEAHDVDRLANEVVRLERVPITGRMREHRSDGVDDLVGSLRTRADVLERGPRFIEFAGRRGNMTAPACPFSMIAASGCRSSCASDPDHDVHRRPMTFSVLLARRRRQDEPPVQHQGFRQEHEQHEGGRHHAHPSVHVEDEAVPTRRYW